MGNQKSGKQQQALAMAVLAYAEHIANPGVLLPELERIGHKHVSLDIRPEHYPIVGNHLLASIKEVLGDAATPEILEAWELAYQELADLMIKLEAKMYQDQSSLPGGWTGWRPFVVSKKVDESEEITSFYLKPSDGGKVVRHIPGQFISLKVFLPDLGLNQARQYSLSNVPNDNEYRISVKRENDSRLNINGMISNHLHDRIEEGGIVNLSAPAGSFTLVEPLNRPLTLISGGVGVTPLLSMLETMAASTLTHPLTWVHACRNKSVHAFRKPVQQLASSHTLIEQHVFYDAVDAQDKKEGIKEGPMDLEKLPPLREDSRFYICGPAGFIKAQHAALLEMGFPQESIFFEEFGPQTIHLN